MTVTTLDANTALLVIDLQTGIVALPALAGQLSGVIRQAATLAGAFRRHALPVVLVNVTGGPPGRTERPRTRSTVTPADAAFCPELNRQPQDHVVTKTTPGAFTRTGLEAYLRSRSVTQVVLAGVATSNGVEVTARQAYELGFNVTLAIDAMADADAEAHAWSLGRVFPRLGETGTTQDILTLLDGSSRS
ncbi:isochorismatase family protein YecD [mine drainage metagenome]|uniref:Isochorismatase family protein YecD n=1 Tax=mine drainage metagenome TaxID=410659 RepID=A0A1J5T7F6_9ZZZZ